MFKLIEYLVELMAMIRIALSPILVFGLAVVLLWFGVKSPLGHILAVLVGIVGLLLGVILAIYIHRKKGAVEFNSHLMATPELDKPEKKEER